ncbi:hypothetical protein [Sulfitobacter donghicola]|nr:hypothetical protein [Sulfitobacter donghicola]
MARMFTKIKVKALRWLLNDYVNAHLASREWHEEQFDYITDTGLAKRLSEEFMSARHIYKMLRAIEAEDWLQRAQVRVQVLMYASIYEAALHHVLFDQNATAPEVIQLTQRNTLKKISIPENSLKELHKHLEHDGREIIPSYHAVVPSDITKVRFDAKANCAFNLGIIDNDLRDDLIEIYAARNAIHIHAEIRKSQKYELNLAKKSYRRMKPFAEQLRTYCNAINT